MTEDELLAMDGLQDPDADDDVQYKWDVEFQKHIASMILVDTQFCIQSIDLIKPSYFSNKAHRKAVEVVFALRQKYKFHPKKSFVIQKVKEDLVEDKALVLVIGEINALYEYFEPGLEAREYLLDKITFFAKIQAIKQAFHSCLKMIDKAPEEEETWQKVSDKLRTALNTDRNFDFGLDYFATVRERYGRMASDEDNAEIFITDLRSVDESIKGGGYRKGEILSIVAASGVGKCFGIDTPILMFDGTIRKVQDVAEDELVMGDDGTPRRVMSLSRGQDMMFDVVPTKGATYRVNSRHILSLKPIGNSKSKNDRKHRRLGRHRRLSKDGILDIPIMEYMASPNTLKTSTKGYRAAVDFPSQEVKITPYFLGVWLGDGYSSVTEITTADVQIVEEMAREPELRDLLLREVTSKGKIATYAIDTQMKCDERNRNSLLNDLRSYDLINNKHVPLEYLVNSREIRLEILAGLIDSDGSESNNCFDFINKNESLAESVAYLARSLGLAAYVKPCRKQSRDGIWRDYHRVTISGDTSNIPVRLPHKRCHTRRQIKNPLHVGIRVVPVGVGEYYGFEVDGNNRFLLGDFTVVHNSNLMACIAAINAQRGKRVVYITLELSEDRVAERFDSILTGTSIKRLYDDREEVFASLDAMVEDNDEKNPIIIKFWPGKSIQVDTIRAYLTQLKFHGYIPDMVVVDYVGEMKDYSGIPVHESRAKIVGELRGLANEGDKFFCVTAMQPNRGSKEAQKTGRIEAEHIGASWDQINPLDGAISLNQNEGEKKVNMGRGHVMKQRSGKSGFDFFIHFDPLTLKIKEIDQKNWTKTMVTHGNQVADEVAIDLIQGRTADELVAELGGHKVDKIATGYKPSSKNDISEE